MHSDSRGYYAALQVAPDATQQEMSRAFRALMRQRAEDVPIASVGGLPSWREGPAREAVVVTTNDRATVV